MTAREWEATVARELAALIARADRIRLARKAERAIAAARFLRFRRVFR